MIIGKCTFIAGRVWTEQCESLNWQALASKTRKAVSIYLKAMASDLKNLKIEGMKAIDSKIW